ncbi:MAG: hypothetical protein B7Y86_03210 [Brevundimonas subvibrioides]|uniref:Flavin reductase like domain-containing protein n=1 Tax=Brevundimonas subvibrioides TaxID=74313 RepID=A0A258HMD9_9CAUL|nr:flavin reductase family protein [Brevundimonas subvibrioides]OYX58036.1 MAG: hypothetical protein B7Y86_03210 [Brevundimonas subvibrioides]
MTAILPTAEDALLAPFKQAMRRHAGRVCIVTCRDGQDINGMAVTSATSCSMAPPSVLVCLNKTASLLPLIQSAGVFGLTVLAAHHEGIAAAFSRKPSGAARFAHGSWTTDGDSQPWLEDALANMSCRVEQTIAYGTHVAMIGRIVDVQLAQDGASLVYRDGKYL